MAYPSQITRDDIIITAQQLIENNGGADTLSMSGLASTLGVKAPSLYRYIDGRDEIINAVRKATVEELGELLETILLDAPDEPVEQLIAVGLGYRTFAQEHPYSYALAFSTDIDDAELAKITLPLRAIMASVAGVRISLLALRGVWSLLHGYVSLEHSGLLPPGGDADEIFIQSVGVFVKGWQGYTEDPKRGTLPHVD